MSAQAPLFSVIVASKNPGASLRDCLASVWMQKGADFEVLVVDGGSTDGTVEWLKENASRIAWWRSAPDKGVYDAMNMGLAQAKGQWILFLGADDRLVGDSLLSEVAAWAAKSEAGVMTGEAAYDDGRLYRLGSGVRPIARNFVHHQATFYRRGLFDENGLFDTSLAVMADYEYNLKLWKGHVRFKPMALRVAACGSGGLSDSGAWRGYSEEIAVRHRYYPAWRCWPWDFLSWLRWCRKRAVTAFRPKPVRRSERSGKA